MFILIALHGYQTAVNRECQKEAPTMTDQTHTITETETEALDAIYGDLAPQHDSPEAVEAMLLEMAETCLLYTSPSPRDS